MRSPQKNYTKMHSRTEDLTKSGEFVVYTYYVSAQGPDRRKGLMGRKTGETRSPMGANCYAWELVKVARKQVGMRRNGEDRLWDERDIE